MQIETKSNLTHAENKIGIKQPGKTSIHAIQTYTLIGVVKIFTRQKHSKVLRNYTTIPR